MKKTSQNSKETAKPHLKPYEFKPGECGNPKGRPKGAKTGLRSRLRQALKKEVTPNILMHLQQEGIELKSKENAEALAHVLLSQALHGDIQSAKLIAEQTEMPLAKEGGGDTNISQKNITVNVNTVNVNAENGAGNGNGDGLSARPKLS